LFRFLHVLGTALVPFFARVSEQPLFRVLHVFRSSPCSIFCTHSRSSPCTNFGCIPLQPLFRFWLVFHSSPCSTYSTAALVQFFARIRTSPCFIFSTYSAASLGHFLHVFRLSPFSDFCLNSTEALVPFFTRIRSIPCSEFCPYSAAALVLFLARIPASFFNVFRQFLFWLCTYYGKLYLARLRQHLICFFFHGFLHLCSLYDTYSGSLCSAFCAHLGRLESLFFTRIPAVFCFFMFSGSLCPIVLQILKQPLMLIARNPAASFLFLKVPSQQFRSAWKWFGWIGLGMYMDRRR
jgi:hypothetical protein